MFVYRLFLFFFFLESRQRCCCCFLEHFVSWLCNFQQQPGFFLWSFFFCGTFHSTLIIPEERSRKNRVPALFLRAWLNQFTKTDLAVFDGNVSHDRSLMKFSLLQKHVWSVNHLKKYIQLRLLGVHIPYILQLVLNASFLPDICLYPTILKKLIGQDAAILKSICFSICTRSTIFFFFVRYQLLPCFLHVLLPIGRSFKTDL